MKRIWLLSTLVWALVAVLSALWFLAFVLNKPRSERTYWERRGLMMLTIGGMYASAWSLKRWKES